MSKKSRKRNRRLLMLAALAGGAALSGRKGTAFPRPKKGTIDQMAADATDSAVTGVVNPNLKKKVISAQPMRKDIYMGSGIKKSDTGQLIGAAGLQDGQSRGQLAQAMAANAAKNRAMNYHRSQTFDARPRNLGNVRTNVAGSPIIKQYKKGGSVKKARVTGIAKRGFGRALMKGKK